MQLQLTPYPTGCFTHNAEAKILVTDASDLQWRVGVARFEQLYDDACDTGIAVINPRTGSVTYWYYVAEVHNADGDLTHWILQPTNESCRKHPGVQCYTMHILND